MTEKMETSNEEVVVNKLETTEPATENVVEKKGYTMDANGYVTSFGEMTDEEIAASFIRSEPENFRGVLGRGSDVYEIGNRWKQILNQEQEAKRSRLKEMTGKELTKSERLKNVWTGLGKIIKSPIYFAAGALTVLGVGHGAAHTSSQSVIGWKRIWSGITGKHFDESDNSKWYNRANNRGV